MARSGATLREPSVSAAICGRFFSLRQWMRTGTAAAAAAGGGCISRIAMSTYPRLALNDGSSIAEMRAGKALVPIAGKTELILSAVLDMVGLLASSRSNSGRTGVARSPRATKASVELFASVCDWLSSIRLAIAQMGSLRASSMALECQAGRSICIHFSKNGSCALTVTRLLPHRCPLYLPAFAHTHRSPLTFHGYPLFRLAFARTHRSPTNFPQ